jgi:hypothetical protein
MTNFPVLPLPIFLFCSLPLPIFLFFPWCLPFPFYYVNAAIAPTSSFYFLVGTTPESYDFFLQLHRVCLDQFAKTL